MKNDSKRQGFECLRSNSLNCQFPVVLLASESRGQGIKIKILKNKNEAEKNKIKIFKILVQEKKFPQ